MILLQEDLAQGRHVYAVCIRKCLLLIDSLQQVKPVLNEHLDVFLSILNDGDKDRQEECGYDGGQIA